MRFRALFQSVESISFSSQSKSSIGQSLPNGSRCHEKLEHTFGDIEFE